MAESVMSSLLQQLSRLAFDEFLLAWTSKRELEKLHHTIATIKDIAQDAEQKRATDPKIARWLSRLRAEIYSADDFFDVISARILQKKAISGNKLLKEVRFFFSKSNNHLGLLISTARKVKQIRDRLDALAKDINDFGFLSTSHTEAPNLGMIRREEHSYVKADDIIGREKEKESLLNMLIADAEDVDGVLARPISVVTIVGMGGLGKTALAQLVFNEKDVQEHFELCLWACMNDFSNLNIALEKIVASGSMDRCEGYQLEQLQRMLREMIGDKKYLLVLDDVWDDDLESWHRLKHLLDVGKNGSKILVTTRLKIIAHSLAPVGHLYLQGLSDEDAWSLFKKVAFHPNQFERIQRLEKFGRGIVKKCANVPLAIRIMGSFLRNKDEDRWSYAFSNEISQGHDKIMKVLKISYNDLPWSLKHCYAYCSLFPKGYEFRKDQLIKIWMAQGFLESADQKRNLEDIGDDCFSSLLERCFFQDVQIDGHGDIVSCKMHDLLHDLAVDVAGKECFMVKSNMNAFTEICRHLSYACYAKFSEENIPAFSQMEGLRTLLFHRGKDISFSCLDGQIFRLRCLRALDLSWLSMKELPSSIGILVHLRYLDLSGNKELIKLPASVCKLQNLMTLKLNWCRSLEEFPSDFKLLCLRHLELDTCDGLARMPSGLKEMTCLVTLSKFVVDKKSGGLRHLRLLNNLRGDLTIQLPVGGWENCVADAEESMLKSKTKLRRLNIQWSVQKEGPVFSESEAVLDRLQPPSNLRSLQVKRFPGRRISDWVSSLEHLIELEISYCLSCLQLPPLRQLKDLKTLELYQLPLVEFLENDVCYSDTQSFFPSLETLDIDSMDMLKGWWRQEGVDTQNSAIRQLAWFRRVSKVTVWNCPNLTDLPSFPYVEELGLRRVHGNLLQNTAASTFNWCRMKGLHIYQIEGSVYLPDGWAEAFSTLQTLYVEKCSKLQPLSQNLIKHLTALETLVVTECEEFNLVIEEQDGMIESQVLLPRLKWLRLGLDRSHLLNGLHCLIALERLEIRFGNLSDKKESMKLLILPPNIKRLSIEKMKRRWLSYFSEAFHQLSKLEVLEFYYCEMDETELNGIPWESLTALVQLTLYSLRNMEALPNRCQSLYSLRWLELNIGFCDGFKSLPDWIAHIKRLRIKECGEVSEKYKNLTGPCWSQISHIPDVQVS